MEHQVGGKNSERTETWVHNVDCPFPHEFYKSHLMIEAEIITSSNTQDKDI